MRNSRFASNLAYTRPAHPSQQQQSSTSGEPSSETPTGYAPQPNPYAALSGHPGSSLIAPRAAGETPAQPKRAPEINLDSAVGQPYVVYEGTTLDAVLMNRLDGDAVGPVKVLVSNPLYSHDHQHVLIPDGTIVLGEAKKIGAAGFGQQRRLAVVFHRMIMPDGYSIDLDQFRRLDQIGEEGLKDKVNNHYLQTYAGNLRKWILPRWRSYRLADVKAVQVEQWLKSLPVSRGTKAKIRNIMSALYSHAQRWEWTTTNPITHVRQSAKRSRVPTVLTPDQLKDFLANLAGPAKTAVLLGALTGLRVGELLGLKWSDIDFEKLEIYVIRDVVKQRIERCKTEASKKAIPIDAELAETLWSWRLRCPYNQPEDWVFGSPQRKGKQPYWPSSLFRVALQPALKAAGIIEPVGWHTLRHTFGTLMKANGEDVKTIQELLRHANFKATMDVYTQAVTDVKRTAHSRVARQIMGPIREGEKDDE